MKCIPTSRSRRPRPAGPKQQNPSAAFRNVTGSKPVSERTSQGAGLPGCGCPVRMRLCSLEPPLWAPQACSTPGRTAASALPTQCWQCRREEVWRHGSPSQPRAALPSGSDATAGGQSVVSRRACSWPCTVFTRGLLVQISPSSSEWLSQHQLSGQNLTQNIL